MLSNKDFIRQSLELNLFFMRIMKEHAIFLEAGFTLKDSSLARQADAFKNEFEALLKEAVSLSYGIISPEVASSGEIVTDFTLNAETATQFYTGIPIDTSITRAELSLVEGAQQLHIQMLVQRVADLNQRAVVATTALADFKGRLLNDVLACRLFTHNYPLLIDHIRREALFYLNMLMKLQNRVMVDIAREAVEQESFWNRIMAEHAKFIRGLLDPTEEALFNIAHKFGKEFDALTAQALALHEQVALLPRVTAESLRATAEIRDFKRQGTEGLLMCKIRSMILPLLGDHTLKEANHYLRLLKMFNAAVPIN